MGSANSKMVIKQVNPKAQPNTNAVNTTREEQCFQNVQLSKPTLEQSKEGSHKEEKVAKAEEIEPVIPPFEEEIIVEEKPPSKTLKETERKLKLRGYVDPVLIKHCDMSPEFVEDFIVIYERVQEVKQAIANQQYLDLLESPLTAMITRSLKYYETNPAEQIPPGNLLAALGFGKLVRTSFDKIVSQYPKLFSYDRGGNQDNTNLTKAQNVSDQLVCVCINYSDLGDEFCLALNDAGMVSRLFDAMEQLKSCISKQEQFLNAYGHLTEKTARGLMLTNVIAVLNNLSKRVPVRASFHACNAVAKLLPLTNNKVLDFATIALLTLAYLIDESNNELIMSNEGPIKFLVHALESANETPNHRYLGFSSTEVVQGLIQLAVNDSNKKLIMANNVLPNIKPMLTQDEHEDEKMAALELLWTLAFNDDNKNVIKIDGQLLYLIKMLKDHENQKIQKAASGVLWEIEEKPTVNMTSTADPKQNSNGKKHVMISYQWDVQKTLIQVKNNLQKAGYNVWMDLEQMGGSTLEAMAGAVENSAVVLVCVSQRYKESANCRSEAEYAFQLKKDIVPLMMDSNYRPDGWLGMVVGSKLWFDFSKGQQKIRDLIKELGARGRTDAEKVIKAVTFDVVDSTPVEQTPQVDIKAWTNKDVMAWIQTFGLEVKKKNGLNELTGSMLVLLHQLRKENPEYYYASLKDEIGLFNVYNVLRFTNELEKLLQ